MYALVQGSAISEFPVDPAALFPGTSMPAGPVEDAMLPDGLVYVHQATPPEFDPAASKLVYGTPQTLDGKWTAPFEVVPLTADEIAANAGFAADAVRRDRNNRLAGCDWTQVSDAPVDKAAWAAYRQALRDISTQPGFPTAVLWPTPPQN